MTEAVQRGTVRLMDAAKRKALESAGWKLDDAADFLEMSDEERQLLDARAVVALALSAANDNSRPSELDKRVRPGKLPDDVRDERHHQ